MLAIQCSVCVLVAACPCTLGLIAPLVTHVGIKKIEKTGITFREPEHLETAAIIDCVMIDLVRVRLLLVCVCVRPVVVSISFSTKEGKNNNNS